MDPVKNFAKVTVYTLYDDTATSILLNSGDGAKLPNPSTDGYFNLIWWNSTNYPDPSDDPNREIVRCTARSTDTLTITRAQEGTSATTKNTTSKTYKMILAITSKTVGDIQTDAQSKVDTHSSLTTAVHGVGGNTVDSVQARNSAITTHGTYTSNIHGFDSSGDAPSQAHGSSRHTGTIGDHTTSLTNVGSNTHAQIDTAVTASIGHIAANGTSVHGLGTISTQAANSVAITGGSISGITDLAVADGGTGASTAATARLNLGSNDSKGRLPTAQLPTKILNSYWHASSDEMTVVQGTYYSDVDPSQVDFDTALVGGGNYIYQFPPANGNEIHFGNITLLAGSYRLSICYLQSSVTGILNILIGTTSLVNLDMFGSYNYNKVSNIEFNLGVPLTGNLRFVINGKNASSTNYYAWISRIEIIRIGAVNSTGIASITSGTIAGVTYSGLPASIWLGAESAYLPATNPAVFNEAPPSTTYAGWSYLTFDDTTAQTAIWRVPLIGYDNGNIIVTAYSKPQTTPAGAKTLQYDILTIGLANGSVFDTAVLTDTGVNISHALGTTTLSTKIAIASATIDPANVATDNILVIGIRRDVTTDDLIGNGQLLGISLKYTKV